MGVGSCSTDGKARVPHQRLCLRHSSEVYGSYKGEHLGRKRVSHFPGHCEIIVTLSAISVGLHLLAYNGPAMANWAMAESGNPAGVDLVNLMICKCPS